MLTDYIIALTHLYGLVDKNKVVEIYNMQNENQIEGIDLDDLTGGNQQINSEELAKNFIQIHHNYFVHDTVMDFNEVEKYLKQKADKPYYIPGQEELLNYKDDFYFEVTKEYLDLLKYAKDHLYKGDEREAEYLAEHIQGLCSVAATPSTIVAEIKNMNLSFKNDQQFDEFFELIIDLANNTRLWEHNGHTSKEIYQLTGNSDVMTYPLKSFVERQVKIGRNDPCPCGSGKKYKKCCM